MDEADADDLYLLQELLKTEDADSSSHPLHNSSQGEDNCSFESVLENLDKIPVKSNSHKNVTPSYVKNERSAMAKSSVNSAIHTGDTDSSDDEDNRNLEHKYSDYGASVKLMLDADDESTGRSDKFKGTTASWKSPSLSSTGSSLCLPKKKQDTSTDVYTDPLIRIRVINPLVSSSVIKQRLTGRKVVSLAQIKQHTGDGKPSDDWVVFGVIVSKLPPRTSAKGSLYSVIKISDLKGPGDMKTVSVFLFSRAYKDHNKDSVGTVLGILNPGILDNSRNHNDEACLSVDNPDRIMIIGTSKDFGTCKSKKKNGDNCTSIVNTAQCEYCVYHVKQEYMKCSRRSDIQSSYNGTGLMNLRNKVLGKNEVFYGGQSFTAVPAKKSKKLHEKDQRRLTALLGKSSSLIPSSSSQGPGKSKIADSVGLSHRQSQKDVDRLRKLDFMEKDTGSSPITNDLPRSSTDIKMSDAKNAALTLIAEKKEIVTPTLEVSSHENIQNAASASSILKAACVIKSMQKKENKSSCLMPSDLGLGLKMSTKQSDIKDSLTKGKSDILKERKSSENNCSTGTLLKGKAGVSGDKEPASLSSHQLLKISNSGSMESRLLKQAALRTAEKEEASKYSPNCTPSMLGLGRSSVKDVNQRSPMLGRGLHSLSTVDLNAPVKNSSTGFKSKYKQSAKLKAINSIKRSGGIQKDDPNFREFESRKKSMKLLSCERKGIKRPISSVDSLSDSSDHRNESEDVHKEKMAKFKELMETSSKHTELIEAAENEAQDEYFMKLEKKEQLEEKMLNTFKVACKAVRCLTCKYTAFSASDFCKTEKHPLKVIEATKRFWKCGDCGNRTVSLELIPLRSCTNCSSSRWEKSAMIRERKVGISQETLSIRGLEETFIGSVATGGNLNLLVPDDS